MDQPKPSYRKKVYSTLKDEAGLKISESEFYKRIDTDDEYRNKVYTTLKEDMGLTIDQSEFNSRIATHIVKKKDNSSLSSPKKESVSQPQSGSLVGTEENSQSKFRLAGEKPATRQELERQKTPDNAYNLDSKGNKKETAAFDENFIQYDKDSGKIITDNAAIQRSKEIVSEYRNQTSISEEEESQLKQEINDEATGVGFLNKAQILASKFTSMFPRWMGGTSGKENDLLWEEKKEAKESLLKEGVAEKDITDSAVLELAKQIKFDKKTESLKQTKTNDYMETLSDSDLKLFNIDRKHKYDSLTEKDQKLLNQLQFQSKSAISLADDIISIKKEIESGIKSGIEPTKEQVEKFNNLKSSLEKETIELKKLNDSYDQNDKELGTVEQEFDASKRRYGTMVNFFEKSGLALADLGLNVLSAADYYGTLGGKIGSKHEEVVQDITNKKAAIQDRKNTLRKDVSEVNNVEDFIDYATDIVATQLPNLAVTSTGIGGLAVIGAAGSGDKIHQMEESNLKGETDFSTGQILASGTIHGIAEGIFELPTLQILKTGKRVIQAARMTEAGREMLQKSAREKATEIFGEYSGNFAKENLSEQATNAIQNAVKIYIDGDKNTSIFDNAKDIFKDTSVLTGLMQTAPHIASAAIKPFQPKNERIELDKNYKKLTDLQQKLKIEGITEDTKSIIEAEIKTITENSNRLVEATVSKIGKMPKELYDKVVTIEQEAAKIRVKAEAISSDKALDSKTKNDLLESLNNEYKTLGEQKSNIISGTTSVVEVIDTKEQQRLKDLAVKELLKENEGKHEANFTDKEITERANKIYQTEKTNAVENVSTNTEPKSINTEPKSINTEPSNINTEATQNVVTEQAQTNTPSASVEAVPSANTLSKNQDEAAQTNNNPVDGNIQPGATVVEQNTNSGQQSNPTEDISNPVDSGTSESKAEVKEKIYKASENGKNYSAKFEKGVLDFRDENGVEPSAPTKRKLQDKWADDFDFTAGRTTFEIEAGSPDMTNYAEHVALYSENPAEIAKELLSLQTLDVMDGVDYRTRIIAEHIGSKGIEKQSFIDNSDSNYITQGIALQYFAKKGQGRPLDTLAQEMSEIAGTEITEQDIVDFILDNPSGVESFKNSVRREKHGPLENKFSELTGLPANQKFLEKAVKQQIQKDEWLEAYATELDFLSDDDLLSLHNDILNSNKKENGTTEENAQINTGNEGESETTDSRESENRSGIQSEGGRENSPGKSAAVKQLKSTREEFNKASNELYSSENTKNLEWAKANEERLVNDYIESRKGKPINDRNKIDPDAIRESFSEIGYNGANVPLYIWATNHITDLIYDKLLSETENKTITVLTGIGGSGKTHATRSQKKLNLENEGIVYDSALNDINGLSRVVQKAIDAGFRVQVIPVYAEPVTAFKRTIQRGHNEGRWLSAKYFVESFGFNKGKLLEFKEKFPNLAVLPLLNQGDVIAQTLDEAINDWNYVATTKDVTEILKTIENEINSGKLSENEITAIGTDVLRIKEHVGIWTSEMDGIANRVADRVQSIWEGRSTSEMGQPSSGGNDSNRLSDTTNNQVDSEFDNTDLEDDIETQEQGFFSGNKQNLRDLLLSENGPVKLRFPFQKHFKRVFAQTFKANAGLDIQTGEVVRSRNRTLSAFTDQLEYESNQFNKIIRDIKRSNPKKLNDNLLAVNDYMSGNKNADISFLNDQQKEQLDYFRSRIDSLSKSVVDNLNGKISDLESKLENYDEGSLAYKSISDAIGRTQNLIDTIESNMEKYINRSYQIFSDDEYRDNITGGFDQLNKEGQLRVRNAINYLIREEGTTKDEATKSVAEYLSEIRRSKSDFPFSSTGNASAPFLKKRKDIPQEFRELLGESKDPLYNYINTVYKLSQYVANIEYQTKLRDHLINNEIGKLEPELGYVKLTSTDDGWRILNDIYVPVDFKDAMDDMQPLKAIESGFYKAWIKIAGITKINKTILSPTTTARNLISGVFLGANSGHFFLSNPKAMAVAWNNAWTTKKSQKELFSERQKLLKLGVLGDGSNSGELLAILNDFSKEVDRMVNKNAFNQFFDIAKKAYAFGDDFYKVTGFYIEKNRLMEYGVSEVEAEEKAAFRINNGYPTYSYLPKNMQRLRRLPLVGTFVSFPYESIRSTKNNILIAKEDLEAGRTKLAYQRIAGMLVANATLNGLSALTMSLVGLTDDDDDAIRDMLPEWQRNSKLIYLGTKNGKPIFIDGTALFPSETIFKPITTLIEKRDGRKFEDNLQEALNELLSPYISKDITFKTLMEVSENKNQFDQKIYLSDNIVDGVLNEGHKIFNYLMKQVGPGVYNNVTEFMRANEIAPQYVGDKFSSYGKEYTNEEALLGLMGMRISTINYHAAMSSFAYQVKDTEQSDKSSASKLVKTSKVLSEKEIESIVEDYGKYHNQNFEKMLNIVNSGKKMGMSNADIRNSLKVSKLSTNDISALINGKIPPLRPLSLQSVKSYKEKLSINYQGKNISEVKRNFDKNVMLMTKKIFEYNKENSNKKSPE